MAFAGAVGVFPFGLGFATVGTEGEDDDADAEDEDGVEDDVDGTVALGFFSFRFTVLEVGSSIRAFFGFFALVGEWFSSKIEFKPSFVSWSWSWSSRCFRVLVSFDWAFF